MAAPAYGNFGGAAQGTTTITPTMPSPISTGDLLLALMVGGNTGAWSVSNEGGGSWTNIGQAVSLIIPTIVSVVPGSMVWQGQTVNLVTTAPSAVFLTPGVPVRFRRRNYV